MGHTYRGYELAQNWSRAMKPIYLVQNPFFSLQQLPDRGVLMRVECGTSAVYDITFQLDDAETALFKRDGSNFVESLANRVMAFPDHFKDRHTIR